MGAGPRVSDIFVGKNSNDAYYYDLVKGNDSSVWGGSCSCPMGKQLKRQPTTRHLKIDLC